MRKSYFACLSFAFVLAAFEGCGAGLPNISGVGTGIGSVPGLTTFVSTQGSGGAPSDSGLREISGSDSDVPDILEGLAGGDSVDVSSVLSDDIDGGDAALARSERGRVAQIQGNSSQSISEFAGAADKIRDFEERAKISASDVGSHAAALLINDNMIPYEPAGFEKVLVYHFQALNYLMEGKLEDAGVEVRRANAEQERALKAHEEELAEAEEEASSKGFKLADFSESLRQSLGESKAVAAQVKNSFQNAYTFYMSGVVHELVGEPNDAYIDYKKALEIAPSNTFIQRDVARLAKQLSMGDDIERLSKRFPKAFASATPPGKSKNEVIVLFEDGVVPGKIGVSFPIPIPIPSAPGLTSVAFPTFKASVAPVYPLSLKESGRELGRSERICAIDALAVKAYEEAAPAMIARQIVRAAIKGTASSMASKHGGAIAGLGVSVFNTLTERADTRSWRSLPQNAQVLRAEASPGSTLDLVHDGSGAHGSIIVPNEPGKRVVVRATRVGSRLFISHIAI